MSAAQFRTMLVLTLLVSESGWGQSLSDLHLGTWGGSLKIDYELDHQNALSADGSADIDSKQRTTREGVTLRNEGFYFIDPRLAAGNLDLTFELVQDRESGSGTTDSRKARLIGYSFDSTLFEPFPYNGRLYANRTQGLANQPFSRTTTAFENRGAALRLREDSPLRSHGLPYFSANASVEQQHTREATSSVTGQTFRNEERQNNLKLDAHNGFQTADLDVRYAWDQVKNVTSPQASFGSHTANLRYSQDFGPALNRRSDSNLSYFIRTGTSPSSVFAVNEALRIDHYSNLSSSYNYALTQNRTVLGTTVSQDESFQLRHQLYKNLTTTAQVTGLQQELSGGRRTSFAGQLNFAYRRNLPWGGRVSASAGRRSQLDDNRLQVAQINVTDEAQTAPSFLGAGAGFLLSQPFVTGASVVVVDTRGGQRLPTTLGTDYEVLAEGNVTRIVPLPTSAVIQAGDTVIDASVRGKLLSLQESLC